MANLSAEEVRKRDTRFERFLKKNLDTDSFERIRAHDSCLVCSEKEDKAFKYFILSDEWLYLTENPPKTLNRIIHLCDVTSIIMVPDVPSFLSGAEQENCQHIAISYYSDIKNDTDKSNAEDSIKSSALLSASTMSQTASSKPQAAALSYRAKYGKARTRSMRNTHLAPVVEIDVLTPINTYTETAAGTNATAPIMSVTVANENTGTALPSEPLKSKKRFSFKRDNAKASNKKEKKKKNKENEPAVDLDLNNINQTGVSAVADSGLNTTQLAEQSMIIRSGDDSVIKSIYQEDDLHLYFLRPNSNILMLLRCAWNNYLLRGTLEEDPNYKVRRSDQFPFTTNTKDTSEHMETLFNQLKTDLLDQRNTLFNIFYYVRELKLAAERNYIIKRFFWKMGDLFTFMVQQLTKYTVNEKEGVHNTSLHDSKNNVEARSRRESTTLSFLNGSYLGQMSNGYARRSSIVIPLGGNGQRSVERRISRNFEMTRESHNDGAVAIEFCRADELEFILLLLETLAAMLSETEMFSSRTSIVTFGEGQLLIELLGVLTYCEPQSSVVEVNELSFEMTARVVAVLYELMLMTSQGRWSENSTNWFRVPWIVHRLEESHSMESFVGRLIHQALTFVPPSDTSELDPEEAVLVYKQFYVIDMFMHYSDDILIYIRDNFHEEFKYYVRMEIIVQKFPNHYLVSPYAIRAISSVKTRVHSQLLPSSATARAKGKSTTAGQHQK